MAVWINFRADLDSQNVYWRVSDAPVDGENRFNLQVRPEWESDAARLMFLDGVQELVCSVRDDCPGGASIRVPPGDEAGWHAPGCEIYQGATGRQDGLDARNGRWRERQIIPEPQ